MLLYITTGEARDRQVRPLRTIPDTVNELFYLAMREHVRPAAVQSWDGTRWMQDPDWRFDRQVVRVALQLMNRMEVGTGERVAVVGPLRPLWLQVDFAVQGLGGVPVGLRHDLADEQLTQALAECGARVAFATDPASAERLLALRPRLPQLQYAIKPDGIESGEENGVMGMQHFWDRAQILDTPERAQEWRSRARTVEPDQVAGEHYGPGSGGSLVREAFTHRDAMEFVRDRVTRSPGREGDVTCFEATAVTATVRKAFYASVGDGYTVTALPGPRGADALAELGASRLVASAAWLTRLSDELARVSGVGRTRRLRERAAELLGGGVRWIEPASALPAEVEHRLLEAALPLPALGLEAPAST
jgi:hypothetical protein